MSRLTENETKELITQIGTMLNEDVFGVIYDYLELHPEMRGELNSAFPFPNKIKIGILNKYLVVEYVGPEDKDSNHISITGQDRPRDTIENFLDIDIKHEFINKFPISDNIENMVFFLGYSMNYLTDYFYDLPDMPYELICLNGMVDFESIETYTYISNTTIFWTDVNNLLKIRRIDFMEIVPLSEMGVDYHNQVSLELLVKRIIELKVPKYNVKVHQYLNEFIELISLDETTEVEITNYLSCHPQILQYALGCHELNPQILLEWQYETTLHDLKPDFMPQRMDGYCDIMEFKMPHISSSYMVGTPERRQASFQLDSAIAQINQYHEWCSQKINTDWLESKCGIKVFHPNKYLIIGHSKDFDAEERRRLREERNVIIYTYDEFIEMARFQVYRFR